MQVDVARLIDGGKWTPYQSLLIAGTALAIILDGIDNQLLGNAIPSMMQEWSLPRSAFSTVLAMSPLGMMLGGAIGGTLGDRIGRRTALLGSVIAFAVPTVLICAVGNMWTLGLLRFIAGLGLGGAMPTATALASEYVPRRLRPFAVTLTIVCIPLGGMLAAFLSAYVIPVYGWRTLFFIGGIVPVVLGLVLFKVLPESPRYLACRQDRWQDLIRVLRKLGHDIPSDATFIEDASALESNPRTSLRDLFAPTMRIDTFALFSSFFFCLLVNYLAFLLLVPTLTGAGFPQPAASGVLGWWNIGGVLGALGGAVLIQRIGSKAAMLGLSVGSIVSAIVMAAMPLDPQSTTMLLVMAVILASTVNAVQTAMYALAAHVYPTEIRGTGLGVSLAVGRIGNVLAPYAGNAALDAGGAPAYFSLFAAGMVLVFVSLALIRRHIERSSADVRVVTAENG